MTRRLIIWVIIIAEIFAHQPTSGQNVSKLTEAQVEKIVLKAAESFSAMSCKDFIAVAEYENVTRCKEHYCQALLSYGLFGSFDFRQDKIVNLFDDPSIGNYRPVGAFNSLFRTPGGTGYEKNVSYSEYGIEGIKDFDVTFNQYSLIPPVARKRAVEVYGPLNPKEVKCFTYNVLRQVASDEYEISFSTKDGVFPVKTRLKGEGILHIKGGTVTGFSLKNVEDRFSHFVGKTDTSPMVSVTDYTYEVHYILRDGVLYPDYLAENVRWVAPEDKTKQVYFWAERNPCVRPLDAGLSMTMKVTFSHHAKLDKAGKAKYSKSFKPSGAAWRVTLGIPTTDEHIGKQMVGIPSWQTVKKDLEAMGKSLEDQNKLQAELYTTPRGESKQSQKQIADRMAKIDSETKQLFKELYP